MTARHIAVQLPATEAATSPGTRVGQRSLVWLGAVTWRFPLLGRTRMLTEAWQGAGRAVRFVQVPSLRSGVERLAGLGSSGGTGASRHPGEEHVLRPWPVAPLAWWPRLAQHRLRRWSRSRAVELRAQLDARLDLSEAVALVVSPIWTPWLDELPFRHVVYDCIDHVDVHTPREDLGDLFRDWEWELVQRATAAVVSATALENVVHAMRPELPVALVRNGVDASLFRSRAASSARPADLPEAGRRPLVGFVGALYEWLDTQLVEQVAGLLPGVDFVFVGPHDGRAQLPRLPNVHALGQRPYDQVPAYIAAFDACWLPFRQGEVAAAANPVKLYEFLALGKPVVSTPVADVDSFEGLVKVGRTAREVTALLTEALAKPHESSVEASRFADRNTWRVRADALADFVDSLP